MRKNIIPIILLLFLAIHEQTVYSQTINDMFKSMPAELLPGVSEGNKTMLIVDTAQATVPYIFGEIQKVKHSSSYLKIKTSEVGNTQIKLLPVTEDSLIIAVIKTVCGGPNTDVCNSIVSFYNNEWEEMDNQTFIHTISPEMFMDSSKKESDNYKYALSLTDIYPISATFDETSTDLTLTFNYKERLTDLQIKEFETYLIDDKLLLKWNGSNFK